MTNAFDDYELSLRRAAHRRVAQRRRQTQARRGLLVAVPLLIAAIFVVQALVPEQATASSVNVVRGADGSVTILLLDAAAAPERVVRDVRREGFQADLAGAATGPSRVGHMVRFRATAGGVPGTKQIVLPAGWAGRVTVVEGVDAQGLPYTAFTDAFAPSEPLDCLSEGASVAAVRRAATARGLTVEWRDVGTARSFEPLPTGAVIGASATSATSVIATVDDARTGLDGGC